MPLRRRAISRHLIALGLLLLSGVGRAQILERPALSRERHILMLDFGDPNRPAFVPYNSAFLARLRRRNDVRAIVYREHHDPRVNVDSGGFDATAVAIWSARYWQIPLDVIVANGPIELDLAVQLRRRLARDLPIIYRISASVPQRQSDALTQVSNATGLEDGALIAPVVSDIRQLLPELRHLLVVTQSENDIRFLRQEADSLLSGVTLHPWYAPSSVALRDSIRRLSADAAVLYISVFLDAEGRVWTPADYLEAFADASTRPVFGLYRNLIGLGIVGGPMIDPARQGEAVADRTLAVLRDSTVARTRFVDTLPPWTATYDWRELSKHRIPTRRLPSDAVVLEAPIPLWRSHPVTFWTVTLFLLLQAAWIVSFATNRRALQRATQRLRALTRRLQSTQEQEQARLSRELHDTLGQDLLSQALDLERYAPTATAPRGGTFAERLRHSVTRLEGIARDLHPNALQLVDIRTGIQQLASDLRHRTGLDITVTEQGLDRPLTDDIRVTIFRVIQEALTNVRRHAQATSVIVMLDSREDRIEVTIRDDGVGFNPAHPSDARLGLLGMQERAAAVHARLQITSAPNDGTTVTLTIPLPTVA